MNVSKYFTKLWDTGFLKDGKNITNSNNRYKIVQLDYRSSKKFIYFYLKFDFENFDVNEFKGNYSCYIKLTSGDLVQSKTYISNATFIEFKRIIKPSYNKSVGSFILPKLPSIILKLTCKIIAYPLPKLEWKRKFDFKEYLNNNYTLSYELSKNQIAIADLYVTLNKDENDAQYQCIMNDSLVINDIKVTTKGN